MYQQGEICLRRAFPRRQKELSHVTNLKKFTLLTSSVAGATDH